MICRTLPVLALLCAGTLAPVAIALPRIAGTPPHFRIYDVDRRERNMRTLLGELANTSALSHQAAVEALGQLDAIRRQEDAAKVQNGGRLSVPIIRTVDAQLNTLSRRLGLREPAY